MMKSNPCIFHGNIGCGKSSWMRQMSLLGYNTVFEDLSDVIYLHDYWETGKFAFHTQIGFYASWLKLYNLAVSMGGAFIDSSIFSHHYIFTKYMYDHRILAKKEYDQCEELFQQIVQFVKCTCIYIRCSLPENLRRVQQRSRNLEKNDRDFICELNNRFEMYYASNENNMYNIDITLLNPNEAGDVAAFVKQLEKVGVNLDSYFRRTR